MSAEEVAGSATPHAWEPDEEALEQMTAELRESFELFTSFHAARRFLSVERAFALDLSLVKPITASA